MLDSGYSNVVRLERLSKLMALEGAMLKTARAQRVEASRA